VAPPSAASSGSPSADADLLAEGRELLERWCLAGRTRYLYPEGPNLALLFAAYQDLERQRLTGRIRPGARARRRAFRRGLRRLVRDDVRDRVRRLTYGFPPPRLRRLATTPALVDAALETLEPDEREVARRALGLDDADVLPPRRQHGPTAPAIGRLRAALYEAALRHPSSVAGLPPQVLWTLAPRLPPRKRHPLAVLILVRLPMQLLLAFVMLFNIAYVGAYFFFNDAVLGRFIGERVSRLFEGDLVLGSVHWNGRLIFDLVTGTPHDVVVEGVEVWGPYKGYDHPRDLRAAYGERLEVKLVLHEIIPWNRLGIPQFLEIPWILHFTEVRSHDDFRIDVVEWHELDERGILRRLLSLRDAFVLYRATPNDNRGLSIAVDDAEVDRVALTLDMSRTSDWEAAFTFEDVKFDLLFDSPPAEAGVVDMPFSFDLSGHRGVGTLRIGTYDIPVRDARIREFRSRRGAVAAGNVGFDGTVEAAGSIVDLRGTLLSVFGRFRDMGPSPTMHVDLDARSAHADALTAHMVHELELPLGMFVGHDSPARASITGPVTDPIYGLQVQHLSLDLTGEPAWSATDVDVALQMSNFPIPEPWRDQVPDDGRPRRVVKLQRMDGRVLGGRAVLPTPQQGVIVMPEPGEPFFIDIPLDVTGIDPARFVPDQPSLAPRVAGSLSGHVHVRDLVIGPPSDLPPGVAAPEAPKEVLQVRLDLDHLVLDRHRGPAQDGLPRTFEIDGRIALTADDDFAFEDVVVRIDGARLDVDGQLQLARNRIDTLALALTIDDGTAFSRGIGMSPYFSAAHVAMVLEGPWSAPSSKRGELVIADLLDPLKTSRAALRMHRGVVFLESDDVQLLGGRGAIEARAHLFAGGGLSSDPRVHALVDLRDMDLAQLPGEALLGRADVELEIGDGHGNATPLSQLRIMGAATSETMELGGTSYRDAAVSFQLFSDELAIHQLILPIRRPVSPFMAGRVQVPVGEIHGEGTITIEDDPELDLLVQARGVPIDIVSRLLDVDAGVRGQIGRGTELRVGGRLSQPRVDGVVALNGLSAKNIALGSGRLDVTSEDFPAQGPLAAHRELRVRGELATRRNRNRERARRDNIEWTVDAVVALGARHGNGPEISAQLDVTFRELSIPHLLFEPADDDAAPPIDGQLQGASAHVLTCSPGPATLSDCLAARPPAGSDKASLAIELNLDRAWIRGGGSASAQTDAPCQDPATICTKSALVASLDWPRLEIREPWRLGTGGAKGSVLTLEGVFDLSPPSAATSGEAEASEAPAQALCVPTRASEDPDPPDRSAEARIQGALDLRVLAGLLPGIGLDTASGRLKLDLSVDGPLPTPRLAGRAELEGEALAIDLGVLPVPLEFRELGLEIHGDWLLAHGRMGIGRGMIEFGSIGQAHTGYAFTGRCAQHFGVAAKGEVGSDLLGRALGSMVTVDAGGVGVHELVARGRALPTFELSQLEGSIGFGTPLAPNETCSTRPVRPPGSPEVLSLEFTQGLSQLSLDCGRIAFRQCAAGACAGIPDGWYRLALGENPRSDNVPRDAVRFHSGPRGEVFAWGDAYVSPDFDRAENTDLEVQIEDLPIRSFDGRGRLAYEAEVTSERVTLSGGQPLVATGSLRLDRGRYIKDAIQGVEILTLTEEVESAASAPPPILQGMRLDLGVETDRPLRIENNLAHGVQATLAVNVSGSYEAPEFVGRVDVEPGGTVQVPFLTGHYEIQRGRVTLLREWGNAEVDVVAERQEPVYIDNQPRRVQLLLGGTLSAIRWGCVAEGDTSGELDSLRACTEYLVLGTGDVQISDADVQRFVGRGLVSARKPLQVVSHLTEIDVGEQAAEAAPRLRNYVPDVRLRLGQIGPELEIATPTSWFDWGWGRASVGWDYIRGYPGFLLRQSRELSFRLRILDPVYFEIRRRNRSYLNNRIIFDPLEQTTLELKFDFDLPSLR